MDTYNYKTWIQTNIFVFILEYTYNYMSIYTYNYESIYRILTFKDFIKKHKLKNKATSNIKIQQILSSLSLNDVGIYLGDGPF